MGLRYSQLKIFQFPEKLHSLPRENPAILPPLHVRVKPTNICPHNCRYCAYRVENLQLGSEMDPRQFIAKDKMAEITEDLIEMGVRAVTFSGGGDPFCYPYLAATTRRLAEASVAFAALTNGAGLIGELAEVFAHLGLWLRISIDGWDDDSYARYRNIGRNEFSRVVRNIEAFKKLGGPCFLGMNLIVDHENASHVYDMIKMAHNIGADSIKISPCIVSNSGGENNRFHEPFFYSVHAQIRKAAQELAGTEFEIYNSYHQAEVQFEKPYDWCPFMQVLPVIGADLNVYACQDKAYSCTGLIGSITQTRFRDFWFDAKEKFFRVKPCRDCNHHCVADPKNRLIIEYLGLDSNHLGFV